VFNYFEIGCDCEQSVFPALPEDIDCSYTPRDSQIVGLVMLPLGASLPTDWTSAAAFVAAIDNTETAGRKGKYFIGMGDVPESADIIVPLGRGHQHIAGRVWTLNFAPGMATEGQYNFLRTLQRQHRQFRFWFATMGGRVLGGPQGIKPSFVTAKTLYGGGREDLEAAKIVINWRSCAEPDRVDMPSLFNVDSAGGVIISGGGGGGGGEALSIYQQEFTAPSGTSVTVTANGGVLPAESAIMVFFNGQFYTGWTKAGSAINMGFTLDPLHIVNVVFFA